MRFFRWRFWNRSSRFSMKNLIPDLKILELDQKLLNRPVNEGFSGGEKKRNEIFQMAVLEPKLAILDEKSHSRSENSRTRPETSESASQRRFLWRRKEAE